MFQIESIIYNIMEYLEFPNDEIIVSRTKQVIKHHKKTGNEHVHTAGTVACPLSENLIITPAATHNSIGQYSIIHFYCKTAGEWLVRVDNVHQGTGDTGNITVN